MFIMEKYRYPSLLIITRRNVLNDTDSTSVTIRSFLGNWPADKLSLVCCEDFNAGMNGRESENCFKLTNDNVWLGSLLFKTNNRKSTTAVGTPVNSNKKGGIVQNFKFWAKHTAQLFYTSLPYKKNADLFKFIEERKPEVIYSNFTNYRVLRLVNDVSDRYHLPVVPHFFDDWPNTYFERGSIGDWFFQRSLRKLLGKSSLTLCISPKMCKEYMKRYHIEKAYPLLNSVERLSLDRAPFHDTEPFKILFAGSLYLGRHESLLALCECVKESGKNAIVQICAPKAQWGQFQHLFQPYRFVEYGGFVTKEELIKKIEVATCLLFAESFKEEYLKYTSLSLSTRVPEYLSTGVPILALGNKEQGSLEYLAENHAAYVAYTEEEIAGCLDDCVNHVDEEVILKSAKQLFETNHLRENQQKRFFGFVQSSMQFH